MNFANEIIHLNLEDEMKRSYLDYAMSVIVGRALPDVRDGLKPVHRRVLFTMSELGNDWNKSYKKSARVVGDVMGKYHPHGDSAIYDTIVRMAQTFSMRYLLVDGQGNFGSVDGDSAAAMRYTEVRMAKIAHEMLADIDKETVDFAPNYDESEREPTVLPSRIPCLLINGSSGIAVGMATNIPPHNLTEVINACLALISDPDITINGLIEHVKAPDLPTAGIINGVEGIHEAYHTGRGRMVIRARSLIETRQNHEAIIINELPYQVNKARLIEKIAELVRNKKIEGISEMRDESDKDGMRIVIELKRGESAEVLLNNLYQQTQMQTVFGINMVALVNGQPRLLNLKQILECFVHHRREVVTRRSVYELRKAREKAHIQEGLAVALANIDEIIATIKSSAGAAEAKDRLMARAWAPGGVLAMLERAGAGATIPEGLDEKYGLKEDGYHLSDAQAQAILEMRLNRLTGLEQNKILTEYEELIGKIKELFDILNSIERLMEVICSELVEIREQYGDPRKTEIMTRYLDLTLEDLITEEEMMVTLSHEGYVKSQPISDYRAQRRGGKGKSATAMKEEDFIERLFVASTHDWLLCFTSRGKLYWLKVYDLPAASRASRGKPIVNLLPLEPGEKVNAVLNVRDFNAGGYVLMVTEQAVIKKTELSAFSRPRQNGINAIFLKEDDCLVDVAITSGEQEVMLFNTDGKAIRFHENQVRPMGRNASGIRGMRLQDNARINALIVLEQGTVLCVTENGFGKRSPIDAYPCQNRGGQGVIAIHTSVRNGQLVGAVQINDEDEIMLVSRNGTLVRTRVNEIPVVGRNTQGVTIISLTDDDVLVGIESIPYLSIEGESDEDLVADDESAVNAEEISSESEESSDNL